MPFSSITLFADHIHRFRLGSPFNTEAVVASPIADVNDASLHLEPVIRDDGTLLLSYPLAGDDRIYGMGQGMGGINKRGRRFVSWCSDDPCHTPDKEALYGAHPFLIIDGENHPPLGLFIDYPGEMVFDLGFTRPDRLEIHVPSLDVDIYQLCSASKKAIVRDFRQLIGQPYLPPRWGFGYQQCRWSYENARQIDGVIAGFRDNDIPCDAVYMDIDYMVDYKDFTIDADKFPDFPRWVQEKKAQGIRLVPIIDAGVRIEEGYDVYEEGLEKGYFCTTEDGSLFQAAVWPGLCAFPDFLKPEVRQWWGRLYQRLTDLGIEGFWNDMNEPALFYSPQGLEQAMDTVAAMRGKNIGIHEFFQLKDAVLNMANSREDYRRFYHEPEPGLRVNHEQVHNLFGTNMTRAASEGFEQIDPDRRYLMFSRASSVGAHRYGGIWFGDNHSWWEHLKLHLQMLPGANFCGFLYSGADMGGFGGHASGELVIRWTQLGVFTPLMRNHAALGTRQQEPFSFDPATLAIIREHIKLRYRLVTHLYSEFMYAAQSGDALFYPLAFDFDDRDSARVEDQLLVGNALMCAPVYQANASGRYLYLPEPMLLWKVRRHDQIRLERIEPGHHYLACALDELPLFIRQDRMLVLNPVSACTDEQSHETLEVVVFLNQQARHRLYHDDGISHNLASDSRCELELVVEAGEQGPLARVNVMQGVPPWQRIDFHIHDGDGKDGLTHQSVTLGGCP